MTLIEYDRYIQLVTDSGLYNSLKSNQLPELRLAMVLIIILVAVCIGMGILLRHEEQRNKVLHDILKEDRCEDTVTEKEADLRVEHKAHRRVQC